MKKLMFFVMLVATISCTKEVPVEPQQDNSPPVLDGTPSFTIYSATLFYQDHNQYNGTMIYKGKSSFRNFGSAEAENLVANIQVILKNGAVVNFSESSGQNAYSFGNKNYYSSVPRKVPGCNGYGDIQTYIISTSQPVSMKVLSIGYGSHTSVTCP